MVSSQKKKKSNLKTPFQTDSPDNKNNFLKNKGAKS